MTATELLDARRYLLVPRLDRPRCPKDLIIRHDMDPWGVHECVGEDAFLVVDVLYLRELGDPPVVRVGERMFDLRRSKL